MELRKQPPESLCQLQELAFAHPSGKTTPLAKESTVVDVCDFEEDTKPSSKTVVDLQSDSAKVAPSSKTVIDLQEENTSDKDESAKKELEYWKSLFP
jgi:hypothetical protein